MPSTKRCSNPILLEVYLQIKHLKDLPIFSEDIQSTFTWSKSTKKIPERRQCHSDVVIVNFKQISQIALVFPLLTLIK